MLPYYWLPHGWRMEGGRRDGDAMEMMMELTFLAPCEIFGAIAFAWPQNENNLKKYLNSPFSHFCENANILYYIFIKYYARIASAIHDTCHFIATIHHTGREIC